MVDLFISPGRARAQEDQLLVALRQAQLDRLRLQKVLFLVWYRAGRPQTGPFQFQPYLYGPCAFDLYGALDRLESRGLVAVIPHVMERRAPYHLTPAGKDASVHAYQRLGAGLAKDIEQVARWAAAVGFNSLLTSVYREAPEFATRSVVAQAR